MNKSYVNCIPKFVKDKLDSMSDTQLYMLMEILGDYKENRGEKQDKEEEPDITKIFSADCSMNVHIMGDEKNETSCVEVEFDGCKGVHDLMLIAVAATAGILDNLPDDMDKVKFLAEVGTLAISGKNAGIYNSKEEMLAAHRKEKEE